MRTAAIPAERACADGAPRYDKVPDTLVLNNTLQIKYADSNANAGEVTFDEIATLNDTEFVPVLKREMYPADVQIRLDVSFDVS